MKQIKEVIKNARLNLEIFGNKYSTSGYLIKYSDGSEDFQCDLSDTFKVGETITDGYKTYVKDRDGRLHYVDSGNHAEHHVSVEILKEMMKRG